MSVSSCNVFFYNIVNVVQYWSNIGMNKNHIIEYILYDATYDYYQLLLVLLLLLLILLIIKSDKWSPNRSVIIRVIAKVVTIITSMIADQHQTRQSPITN